MKGQFLGEWTCWACPTTLCRELCKNGLTNRDAVWIVDLGGPKEACITWVYTGTNWQIALNRPCAAAMRPFVESLSVTVTGDGQ